MVEGGHIPVMLEEVVRLLDPRPGETAVDCTAGLGGHAAELARRVGPGGVLVLNDSDAGNVARAAAAVRALADPPRVVEVQGNYAELPRRLAEAGLSADVVLADLGFASSQMEEPGRGFSFSRPGPLDMRFDTTRGPTAADLVNSLSERELGEILRDFGEERAWRTIARKIVEERGRSPIATTDRLASIVRGVASRRGGPDRIDPATRTFQALRIAVNDELGSLRSLLDSVSRAAAMTKGQAGRSEVPGVGVWLRPGARVGIISFHSLEDRMVKESFAELTKRGLAAPAGRQPVEPGPEEVARNPRARSAKLRVVRLIGVVDNQGRGPAVV